MASVFAPELRHDPAREPSTVTVGPRFEETRDLAVREIAALVRADIRARLAELKAAGSAPAPVRVAVRYEHLGAGIHAINVAITAPKDYAEQPAACRAGCRDLTRAAVDLVREFETLRATYNRQTHNTSADRARYYGDTTIGA
jgi:hypothetical protein